MTPLTLSDGLALPRGTVFGLSAGPMNRDAAYYDDPLRFDGYRFCADGARAAPREYTDTEPGNLNWGQGRWTCPGRWYASALIKLLLATLLVEYDFGLPEGQTCRPPSVPANLFVHPNMAQAIVVRKA